MRCPATKFITHTLSNLSFLILLATATFRLDDRSYPITSIEDLTERRFDEKIVSSEEQVDCLLRNTFRPANVLMTNIQICILFWILGSLLPRAICRIAAAAELNAVYNFGRSIVATVQRSLNSS